MADLERPGAIYTNNFAFWQADGDVTRCPNCYFEFSFWVRKHHCRCCGKVFCGQCAHQFCKYDTERIKVVRRSKYDTELAPYRTCVSCYNNLKSAHLLIKTMEQHRGGSEANSDTDQGTIEPVCEASATPLSISSPIDHTVPTNQVSDERDENNAEESHCPICNIDFTKITESHDSHIIETHIEDCIRRAENIQQHHNIDVAAENVDVNAHIAANACPTVKNRMLIYKVPVPHGQKKESIREEDYEECPICFEAMMPGQKVGRLECLCVFHYKCIKSWFAKKSQKLAAESHNLSSLGKNFCPLHDAIF
ncbi:phosphatidylinositol-3-phosphate-binding ubiquitin-protein ligase KNAG_0B04670 [Huiozyma naganishii CBS 8797]|uniref:RING-type E3 ubiquitin transferase n=1 Tax=Huiozyma naganishii (strain ATCC MYA-139 / BCRC 22969 / CBS 8797 / KCTC 17520 / NBRC 10181 / NCYC 3082 / Yp74L-3) TaxID=1071383 RepID=J7RVF2_HUIN7|nr:hypothetical protein KNAG_0B04670 [Kazachstania naganishii CBS 8797]CCK68902.1 hypothetical protein KNAG_0B04670 [Kazachstania naganishii CBS 8797]